MNHNFLNPCTISDMLHCHYTVTIQLYQLLANFEGGETPFTHKNQMTLQISLQEQVSYVVAIANELIP